MSVLLDLGALGQDVGDRRRIVHRLDGKAVKRAPPNASTEATRWVAVRLQLDALALARRDPGPDAEQTTERVKPTDLARIQHEHLAGCGRWSMVKSQSTRIGGVDNILADPRNSSGAAGWPAAPE